MNCIASEALLQAHPSYQTFKNYRTQIDWPKIKTGHYHGIISVLWRESQGRMSA